ncbi:hypothetical protein [Spiroplasma sp. ChiS]|nr:hypothetical protein [Spiroplasma sp. ChiS]
MQGIIKAATKVADFTYDVFKDNNGSALKTVNLKDSKVNSLQFT